MRAPLRAGAVVALVIPRAIAVSMVAFIRGLRRFTLMLAKIADIANAAPPVGSLVAYVPRDDMCRVRKNLNSWSKLSVVLVLPEKLKSSSRLYKGWLAHSFSLLYELYYIA